MRFVPSLLLWILLGAVCRTARADTEIRVFRGGDVACADGPLLDTADRTVPRLQPGRPLTLSILRHANASHDEHVLSLDLPAHVSARNPLQAAWQELTGRADRWTLRLSWAASQSANFLSISIVRRTEGDTSVLAIVRASRTAVYTRPSTVMTDNIQPVYYVALIEPVYLGFVPGTSLALLALFAAMVGALLALRIPSKVYAALGEEDQRIKDGASIGIRSTSRKEE